MLLIINHSFLIKCQLYRKINSHWIFLIKCRISIKSRPQRVESQVWTVCISKVGPLTNHLQVWHVVELREALAYWIRVLRSAIRSIGFHFIIQIKKITKVKESISLNYVGLICFYRIEFLRIVIFLDVTKIEKIKVNVYITLNTLPSIKRKLERWNMTLLHPALL